MKKEHESLKHTTKWMYCYIYAPVIDLSRKKILPNHIKPVEALPHPGVLVACHYNSHCGGVAHPFGCRHE